MCADRLPVSKPALREGFIPLDNARLYCREIGQGRPVVILHGGPDFDHTYLLPDMDRLSDSYRLIYYDQRGRGQSADGVQPEDVSIESEIADLEGLREYLQLDSIAVLGHSFGGLLAMEYALRHSDRVSHLILMNTSPASHEDYMLFRQTRLKNAPGDVAELKVRLSSPNYVEGEPDAVVDYYRVHFRATVRQPEHLESLLKNLRTNFTKEGILKAWAIEDRLMDETWSSSEYDLLPKLTRLNMPTLVIHGDYDLIPVQCAVRISLAIPGARFVLLSDCGHFSYIERPDEVRAAIGDFFRGS